MANWPAQRAPGSADVNHLLGHGSNGAIDLGELTLTNGNVKKHADGLAQIGAALTENGDWMVYGCNGAAKQAGVKLVGRLAQATQATLATSTNLTGNAAHDGAWVLEKQVGTMETALPLMAGTAPVYGPGLANFSLATASGNGTPIVKQTIGSDEVVLMAQSCYWSLVDEVGNFRDYTNLDGTVAYVPGGSKVTITVKGGKTLDFSSFGIVDYSDWKQTLEIASNKVPVTHSMVQSDKGQSWAITTSDVNAQDVSWVEPKTSDDSDFGWIFDNAVLNSITASDSTSPTATVQAITDVTSAVGTSFTVDVRLWKPPASSAPPAPTTSS